MPPPGLQSRDTVVLHAAMVSTPWFVWCRATASPPYSKVRDACSKLFDIGQKMYNVQGSVLRA